MRNGKSVWRQPAGKKLKDEVLPFRPDLDNLGLQFLQDIDHGWDSQHAAFADGNHDRWVPAKGTAATMAHLRRARHPVPLRPGRRLHACATPTTAACSARPTPTATTCGAGGSATTARAAAPRWPTQISPASAGRRTPSGCRTPASPGRSTRTSGNGLDAAHNWGFDRPRPLHRQLRRQRAALLQATTRTPRPGEPLFDQARNGTDVKANAPAQDSPSSTSSQQDVQGGHPAAGLLDRGARGVHRAPELAGQLRRLVRLEGARRAHQRPRRLGQDRAVPDLRRERRLLRPRGPAVPERRRHRRRLDRLARQRAVHRPRRAPTAPTGWASGSR